MSDTAPRWWLYLRVSNDPTGRGLSVASQESELRSWCAREGGTVVGVTTDNDMSASRNKKTRPGYREIHRNMAAGAMDILGCWESSRAQRDLAVYVQTRDLCEQHAVLFAYKGRVYDLSNTGDRFATGLDALLDERYADETRDRVLRGYRTSLERNTARGKIPFGYQREYDPGTGALTAQVPDPVAAPIVRELFARLAAEEPVHSIAADFNRRGVPTPQQHRDRRRGVTAQRGGWTGSKIRRQVLNPQVAGFRIHQGRIVGDTSWTPLVSGETFERVRAYLSNPDRRKQHGVQPRYLLSGILECGVCGAKCRRIVNRGLQSYACHGHNYNNASCVAGRMAPIDALVTEAVLSYLQRPGMREVFDVDDSGEVEDAVRELRDLEARLETFRVAAVDGGLSAETMTRMEQNLLPRIAAARERATPAWVPREVRELSGTSDVAARWEALPLVSKRTVLATMLRLVLHKDTRPRGSRGFDLSRVQIEWRSGHA